MAEDAERFRRFEYKVNSNLVLQRDHTMGAAPRRDEPTGEALSLRDASVHEMGGKFMRENPLKDTRKSSNGPVKRSIRMNAQKKSKLRRINLKNDDSVLTVNIDSCYHPRSEESQVPYTQILDIIQCFQNDPSPDLLREVAHEILVVIKSNVIAVDKKNEIMKLLGISSDEKLKMDTERLFQKLENFSSMITDMNFDEDVQDDGDENADMGGVAVIFDEDAEESDHDLNENQLYIPEDMEITEPVINSDDDSGRDDDILLEEDNDISELIPAFERTLRIDSITENDVDFVSAESSRQLNEKYVGDVRGDQSRKDTLIVDAHWLKRELGTRVQDASRIPALEAMILDCLLETSRQSAEKRLCQIMEYDHFDFCKVLLEHRFRIFYSIQLHRAQGDDNRLQILQELNSNSDPACKILYRELAKDDEIEVDHEITVKAKKKVRTTRLKIDVTSAPKTREARDMVETMSSSHSNEPVAQSRFPAPNMLLDLEKMQLSSPNRFNPNENFTPPSGCIIHSATTKDYEEVTVQGADPHIAKSGEILRVKEVLPEYMWRAFEGFESFNLIQSRVFNTAFHHFGENLLVCAPTGAGKTNVAMICIMNVVQNFMEKIRDNAMSDREKERFIKGINAEGSENGVRNGKIVYVAPMKALVTEVVQSFTKRLHDSLGLKVVELSGDSSVSRSRIMESDIIVCTPEKWDVITRKEGDSRGLMSHIRLVIFDEIHILHHSRGPVIESLVARTLRFSELTQHRIRLVGISATLPNYQDVGLFLRVNPQKGLFHFDRAYRPVPLDTTYIGISTTKAIKKAQMMKEVLFEKVKESAGKHQILIFVHSRKETIRTAKEIRDMALEIGIATKFMNEDSASAAIVKSESERVKNPEIADLFLSGIGVHHAGMTKADRTSVEDLFADRHITLLVSTLTLAWGVNLPAHTVIIKGTKYYEPSEGGWVELSHIDVLQMLGRAGRPQYDSRGHGIIITDKSELHFYLSLNQFMIPIESQLVSSSYYLGSSTNTRSMAKLAGFGQSNSFGNNSALFSTGYSNLPDILNAEIALRTISNRDDCVRWLGYTFLFVRMQRSHHSYDVPLECASDPELVQHRVNLCHSALCILEKNGLIKYDRKTGTLTSTVFGKVASHYYIRYHSMAAYTMHMKPRMSSIELLALFSLSSEFSCITVREEEKIEIAKLVNIVPIPVKGGLPDHCTKVNVLLQVYISRVVLEGFAIQSDMIYIHQNAGRLMRALFELALKRNWADLAKSTLQWTKVVESRFWPVQTPLRHFRAIPEDVLAKLERKDIRFEEYSHYTAQEIGTVLRAPNLGKHIHRFVRQFPRLEIEAYVQPVSRNCLVVELSITPSYEYNHNVHSPNGYEFYWIFVENTSQDKILYYERISVKVDSKQQTMTFTVPMGDPVPPHYFIRCIADKWMGVETLLPVNFRYLILPKESRFSTNLLDLLPLPVSHITWSQARRFFTSNCTKMQSISGVGAHDSLTSPCADSGEHDFHFNPVQTQVFENFYGMDSDVVICAPSSVGRSVLTHLALLRAIKKNIRTRCVIVFPFERLAKAHSIFLQRKFEGDNSAYEYNGDKYDSEKNIKITVRRLKDIFEHESLATWSDHSELIVSTAAEWDRLTKIESEKNEYVFLSTISLIIFDEIHLVSDVDIGSVLESCVTRTKNIADKRSLSYRIILSGASVANAKDLRSWVDAPSSQVFNFGCKIRSVPLRVSFASQESHSPESRVDQAIAPAYQAIQQHAHKISLEEDSKYKGSQIDVIEESYPTLVFVSDSQSAEKVALDLLHLAKINRSENRFTPQLIPESSVWNAALDYIREMAPQASLEKLIYSLGRGTAYLHSDMSQPLEELLCYLFRCHFISLLVVPVGFAWGLGVSVLHSMPGVLVDRNVSFGKVLSETSFINGTVLSASLVVVLDTQKFNERLGKYEDYDIPTLVHLVSMAGKEGPDGSSVAVVMCPATKKDYYKMFLNEELPVESQLDQNISTALLAEIVTHNVHSLEKSISWLSGTLLVRMIKKNPNFYSLQSTSNEAVSTFLSEMVESAVEQLVSGGFVTRIRESSFGATNLGRISHGIDIVETPLSVIPCFDQARVSMALECGVVKILDILDLPDDRRLSLLSGLSTKQIEEIACFCNSYPQISISAVVVPNSGNCLFVSVLRELEDGEVLPSDGPWFIVVEQKGVVIGTSKIDLGTERVELRLNYDSHKIDVTQDPIIRVCVVSNHITGFVKSSLVTVS